MASGDRTRVYSTKVTGDVTDSIDDIFPVGFILLTYSDTNPSEYLTGTTWEAYAEGKGVVGVGTYTLTRNMYVTSGVSNSSGAYGTTYKSVTNTYTYKLGSEGGYYRWRVAKQEMPRHRHYLVDSSGKQAYATGWSTSNRSYSGNGGDGYGVAISETDENGSHLPHNNIQPSLGVNMWKRTD